VGAVVGRVVEEARAYVRPDKPFGFTVVTEDEHRSFDRLDSAVTFAEKHVRLLAEGRLLKAGGNHIETNIFREENMAQVSDQWGGGFLIELKLTARAVGKPLL